MAKYGGKAESGGKNSTRERWMDRLADEESAHKDWRKVAKEARERYEDCDSKVEYNIFQSSIDILRGVAFSKVPVPDVRRRYTEAGEEADGLADILERSIGFYLDQQPAGDAFGLAVLDRLVEGCGILKLEVETKTADVPVIDPVLGVLMADEDGNPLLQKVIVDQFLRLRHWPAHRFRFEPCQTWDAVGWICYDHELTKSEIKEKFSVEVNKYAEGKTNTYTVHEIWDKAKRQRIFVSECYDGVLLQEDAPLDVAGFFPSPPPMFDTLKAKKLEPIPWYSRVKKRTSRINEMTRRIDALTRAIRDVGFYDASFPELNQLEVATDGARVPVPNLVGRLQGASTENVVVELQMRSKAETLALLVTQRQNEEDLFFKDTGLSDIVRGVSRASETATAQQIKAQWANVRLGPLTAQVSAFIRATYRLMGEILGEHFDAEVLTKASGLMVTPEMLQALKSDFARAYIVDIETEATVALDEDADRKQRLEALKVFTDYMNSLLPQVQANAIPADLAKEMLLFAVRSYKHGRQLEDLIEQLPGSMEQLQAVQQQAQQAAQQLQAMQQQAQAMQQQLQQIDATEQQRQMMEAQAKAQLQASQAAKYAQEAQAQAMDNRARQVQAVGLL